MKKSDDNNSIELAKKLLTRMNICEKHKQLIEKQMQAYPVDELHETVLSEAKDSIDKLMEEIATVYATMLSEKDLQGILDFFESEPGKKYIDVSPALEGRIAMLEAGWANSIMQKAQKAVEKNVNESRVNRGINPRDYILPIDLHLYWR